MVLAERIKEVLEYSGLNIPKFAEKVGFKTPQAVRELLSGRTKTLSYEAQTKIISSYPEVSKEWLLTGEGEMLAGGTGAHPDASDSRSGRFGASVPSDRSDIGLPLVPLEAVAGCPGADLPGIALEDCERYVVPEFQRQGAQFLVRVAGASMQPRYYNGDLLAIRRLSSASFIQWGKVYVLDTEQGMLVKKLMPCPEDDSCVVCVSENAAEFPPFRIQKTEIRSLSIVLGSVSVE